ncbi:MAG TPA: hypothetical protein PK878_05070 [bacterium]|nr:hypothetical protein [bacterium]HOL96217.1 hypothetical protein [bacterium]HPP02946.1 hypothetical protein [bacterium]HXK92585.1 hypothetical protein [bacterium]
MTTGRIICAVIAILALLVCLGSSLRVFWGSPTGDYQQDFSIFKTWFTWGTVVWFLSAPYWLIPDFFKSDTGKDEEI